MWLRLVQSVGIGIAEVILRNISCSHSLLAPPSARTPLPAQDMAGAILVAAHGLRTDKLFIETTRGVGSIDGLEDVLDATNSSCDDGRRQPVERHCRTIAHQSDFSPVLS